MKCYCCNKEASFISRDIDYNGDGDIPFCSDKCHKEMYDIKTRIIIQIKGG
jgi:hypothetical protein